MRVEEECCVREMRVGEGPSSPAAGDGDARVSGRGVASGRSSASKKGDTSWRGASGTGTARRGGGDDDGGREATTTTTAIWGKRLSADLVGDETYIEPNLLSRVVFPTETKGTPCVMGRATTRDKWGISRRIPLQANFRPLVLGGVTT
jgi:hypothetical protein